MDNGELLIRWSIRFCLLVYVLYIAGGVIADPLRWPRNARILWTAAGSLFLLHVVAAMHYYHGWSHTHAFEDTAQQTKALIGAEFGYGIYFSYLFGALWGADIACMWIAGPAYFHRLPWLRAAVHAYMAFIAINGAIIFHSGFIRWAGLAACGCLAALAVVMWILNRPARPGNQA